jgi:hypothetical protein
MLAVRSTADVLLTLQDNNSKAIYQAFKHNWLRKP